MTEKVKDLCCEINWLMWHVAGQRAVESSVMDAVDFYMGFGSL